MSIETKSAYPADIIQLLIRGTIIMTNIAIILARSGSKGLKDKNIKLMNGRPLIAYSIEAAKISGLFDVVHVSTDSQKYADIAIEYGADEPFLRSEEMSSDTADSWDAVLEVLRQYKNLGKEFDMVTLLQPTSPIRTGEDIKNAFEIFKAKDANAVISVCESDHPIEWYRPLRKDNDMSAFATSEEKWGRRQDAEKYYRMNGSIYMLKTTYLKEKPRNIIRNKVYAYVMDRYSSVDIDTQFDFDIAEAIIKKLNG